MVIVISGSAVGNRLHPAIIADLLPAGLEIESVLSPEDGAQRGRRGAFGWVGEISRAKLSEARDDRFVAAIDVNRSKFTLAYVVRAVTPGDFIFPGTAIEDMYRPDVFGRTATRRINIASRPVRKLVRAFLARKRHWFLLPAAMVAISMF